MNRKERRKEKALKRQAKQAVSESLPALIEAGMIEEIAPGKFSLTAMGTAYAKHIIQTNPEAQGWIETLDRNANAGQQE